MPGAHRDHIISNGRKGERGRVELFWKESCPLQEKKVDAKVEQVFCYQVVVVASGRPHWQ